MGYYEEELTSDELAYKRYLKGEYTYQDYVNVCNLEDIEPLKEIKKEGKTMKKTYQEKKEEIRQQAIEWQLSFSDDENRFYYSELAYTCEYFEKKGKRYGLLREFRENGII